VADREVGEGGDLVGGLAEHGLDLWQLAGEHASDDVELFANVGGIRFAKPVRMAAATISAERGP